MRNSDSERSSAENLVLTVRGDSPVMQSSDDGYINSNIENIPEPVFYVNSSDYKKGHSESALVAEIESLKLKLKMAKNSNLEAKITIEGCNNDLKEKIMVVKDLTCQIDQLKKKLKDQERIIEEDKRLVNERDEHLTRYYDQKVGAFKSRVAELEDKLDAAQKIHDAEVEKWEELEKEITKRLEKALDDVKTKEKQIMTIKEDHDKLLNELNEQRHCVSLYS